MLTETLAMGKALAARDNEKIDNSQELVAMGAANAAGSFFQSYTSAGSFSRSAVVVSTGGRSQLAGIVTAAAVVATLQFLTKFFFHVPKCVLAACLIVAVTGLIDTKRARNLWSKNKGRFALYLSYLGMMLTFGAAEGLLVSVAAYYAVEVLRWGKAKLAT
jgi:MFS superfamily sulfate permease-like transporter